MKASTVVILGGAVALGVVGVVLYSKHKAAAGTPVNVLTPGGTYQLVVPVLPGFTAQQMLDSAGPLGWTNVTQVDASPGLLAAAAANGIDVKSPNELVWQGDYHGAAAVPLAAGAAAARMS